MIKFDYGISAELAKMIDISELLCESKRPSIVADPVFSLTYVDQVRHRVQDRVYEDEPPGDLVEVDVLVQGQQPVHPELPQLRDGVAEHQDQNEHRAEVQTLTCMGRKNVEKISFPVRKHEKMI